MKIDDDFSPAFFRPHLKIKEPVFEKALTEQVLLLILNRLRKNKSSVHKVSAKRFLSALLANLFAAHVTHKQHYLAISRSKNDYDSASRYKTFKYGYSIVVAVLDALIDEGLLKQHIGFKDRETGLSRYSRIKAKPKLVKIIQTYLEFSDDVAEFDQEIIILRGEKDKNRRAEELEYEDNDETLLMYCNLETINRAISETFLNFHLRDSDLVELNDRLRRGPERNQIDYSRNQLCRLFNDGSFESGGRFYRVWWQELPKEYRKYIEISYEKTVELDYSSIHPSLIYLVHDLVPVELPYVVAGYEKLRPLVKRSFNIMVNAASKKAALSAIRKKWSKMKLKYAEEPVSSVDLVSLMTLIEEKHSAISKYFYTSIGKKMQFIDSQLAEEVMLRMINNKVVVLPVHDSFIVPYSSYSLLKETMQSVVFDRYGYKIEIDEKETELKEINNNRWHERRAAESYYSVTQITEEEDEERSRYKSYYRRIRRREEDWIGERWRSGAHYSYN